MSGVYNSARLGLSRLLIISIILVIIVAIVSGYMLLYQRPGAPGL